MAEMSGSCRCGRQVSQDVLTKWDLFSNCPYCGASLYEQGIDFLKQLEVWEQKEERKCILHREADARRDSRSRYFSKRVYGAFALLTFAFGTYWFSHLPHVNQPMSQRDLVVFIDRFIGSFFVMILLEIIWVLYVNRLAKIRFPGPV